MWEIKEDEYTKRIGKNQVCAIFHMRDIWKNVPKYGDAMLVSPLRGTNPTETSVFEFFYRCISPALDELIQIKVIFILRQRMIRLQNLKNSVTLFLMQKSFLGCQLRCHVTQKPGNSSVLYQKTKNNPFEPTIRRNKGV